jgi:hypothetical protein
VAVLSAKVADQLFPAEEPLGRTVVANGNLYVVVGILREPDPATLEAVPESHGGMYLPLRTCQARFGERVLYRRGGVRVAEQVPLTSILITVRTPGAARSTAGSISELLEQAHRQRDWDVQVAQGP